MKWINLINSDAYTRVTSVKFHEITSLERCTAKTQSNMSSRRSHAFSSFVVKPPKPMCLIFNQKDRSSQNTVPSEMLNKTKSK
jgi:hypothetical protein